MLASFTQREVSARTKTLTALFTHQILIFSAMCAQTVVWCTKRRVRPHFLTFRLHAERQTPVQAVAGHCEVSLPCR